MGKIPIIKAMLMGRCQFAKILALGAIFTLTGACAHSQSDSIYAEAEYPEDEEPLLRDYSVEMSQFEQGDDTRPRVASLGPVPARSTTESPMTAAAEPADADKLPAFDPELKGKISVVGRGKQVNRILKGCVASHQGELLGVLPLKKRTVTAGEVKILVECKGDVSFTKTAQVDADASATIVLNGADFGKKSGKRKMARRGKRRGTKKKRRR